MFIVSNALAANCDVGCSRAQHSVPRRCPRLWGTERSTGIRRWPVYLARASQFPLRGSDQQPDTDFVDSSVGSTLLARGEPSAPHGCFVHGRLDVESFFLPCIPRANPWRLVAGKSLGLLAPSVPRSRPRGRRDCVRSRSIGRFCTAPTPSARALSTRVTPVSPVVSLERNARVRLPARSCVGWTREPGGRASVAFMVEGNNTADAALPHSIRSLARSPFAPLHGPGTTLRRSFGTRHNYFRTADRVAPTRTSGGVPNPVDAEDATLHRHLFRGTFTRFDRGLFDPTSGTHRA